jgi:G3E family GTPase
MSEPERPPVTAHLLTGFLGSGKTTILKQLLAAPELARAAVLVNEFGEVGLDHLLLEAVDEEVVLLPSGCLCCTIRGDLKDAVLRLFERRQQGEIPPFDLLLIETTGLADPAPIVATFAADPMLSHQIGLGNVITLVDAVSGADNLGRFEEATKQVAVADRIVLSKTDLVAPPAIEALERMIARLNPTALRLRASPDGPVPPLELLAGVRDADVRAAEVARWLTPDAHQPDEHGHGHGHGHGHESRHLGIRTLVLELEPPLDWAAFALWLGMLLNRHGNQVLRSKGILRVVGSDTPVVVHGVQHTIHPPVHLDRWPEGRPGTRFVLIVKDLDPALVARSFHAFMRLGAADLALA